MGKAFDGTTGRRRYSSSPFRPPALFRLEPDMNLARSVRLVIGANLLLVLLLAVVLTTAGRNVEDRGEDARAKVATAGASERAPSTSPDLPPPLAAWPPDPPPRSASIPPLEKPDLVVTRVQVDPEMIPEPATLPELPPETPERIRETEWLLKSLVLAIELHRGRRGELPPGRTEGVNEVNEGIEALFARLDSEGLLDRPARARWTGDTDGDGRPEILDAWGNPLVYFRHDDYGANETVRIGGREQAARPRISALTHEFHARDFVQIWSAGPDGVNEDGGGDDVTSWHIRE